MRPAAILFALAGSPPQERCIELEPGARCRLCAGAASRGRDFDRWQGASFTSQDRVRDWSSPWICEACVWSCAWNPPPDRPAPEPGKKGLNLRLFSHLWSERDGYRSANKGDKPAILAWLRARAEGERWFAAIADTGQKHLLPWTPISTGPRGLVRFEETDVAIGDWALVEAIAALLTAGASKAEIERGDYGVRTWMRCKAEALSFEARWSRERSGGWFALALWLAQREEREGGHERSKRAATREDARRDSRDARAVPRERGECADALGPDRSESARRAPNAGDGGGVDGRADADAPTRSAEQLALFGDG